MFQLTDSSEGYLPHLYRLVRPHVIVYSLPIWEAWDVLDLLKANSFGELEIISIVGWLGIILVKGFSFVLSIIAANSLPWVWQGCLRSNLSADRLACVTGLYILLPLRTWLLRDASHHSIQLVLNNYPLTDCVDQQMNVVSQKITEVDREWCPSLLWNFSEDFTAVIFWKTKDTVQIFHDFWMYDSYLGFCLSYFTSTLTSSLLETTHNLLY